MYIKITDEYGQEQDVPVYATLAEATDREVVEPLGEWGDFDVEAIAEEVLVWHTEYLDDGAEWANRSGWTLAEEFSGVAAGDEGRARFWRVVESHAFSALPESR